MHAARADPARRGRAPDLPAGRDVAAEPGELPDDDRDQGQPGSSPPPTGGRWSTSASAARTAPTRACSRPARRTSAAAPPPRPSRPGICTACRRPGRWPTATCSRSRPTSRRSCAFLRHHPDRSTLLIDTHDTAGRGACGRARHRGSPASCPRPCGSTPATSASLTAAVRGDPRRGRLRVDTRIVCSGDLDEYRIADLLAAGARIDGFGVGTALTTSSDAPGARRRLQARLSGGHR